MATEHKLEANRRNAQLSTGPRNTKRTRLNAVSHGILSNEVLIDKLDDVHGKRRFAKLRKALRDDLAPVGELEALLVDMIITLVWRLRRLLRHEMAAIAQNLKKSYFIPPPLIIGEPPHDYSILSEGNCVGDGSTYIRHPKEDPAARDQDKRGLTLVSGFDDVILDKLPRY